MRCQNEEEKKKKKERKKKKKKEGGSLQKTNIRPGFFQEGIFKESQPDK